MLDPTVPYLIDIRNVSRSFPKGSGEDLLVLENVDLAIRSGEIVGLLGRSGSGKSTLLRIIAGLTSPSSGDALCRGETIKGPPHGVSMVFQSFALFPWLTVLQNVELGLEALGVERSERRKRALAAIDLIGLDGFESAYPKELSGGMRQRVGFARALVVHPDLLLMDEPFSALDVLTAETLRTDLVDLWIEGRLPIKSVLIVTHNIEEAVLMCDRILVFSSNPGRVAAEIKVDLPHPRNRLDPVFRALVDSIYARMTQRAEPRAPTVEGFHGAGVGMALNHVSSNLISGLVETLAGPPYNGHADLPVLAESLQLEADELFHLAEALQLLRFAQLSEGDVTLTEAGKHFAHLETDARKRLFAEHLVTYVPLIGLIRRVLDERPSHTAPVARFRNELEDYMSEDYADETLKTIVSWGRYGELFAYDEQQEMFSLENPH
ncbi:nitrate/sulfonate/bicarbonate ABC transporter ATP-binding protein [Bradyrhizobium sp. U87765 SZCCT0131]|uniref:ABC transporter ATP-binding protein n=1 Tax=unclassified Bradyrhizobium TaxID=2631580 RepID=UPI001BA61A46|nr:MULTISPECIES: nitrate/sulfonate/bicarbonate ABC transporter ATP-binding protein [unclassified Bradyrhizobium]MBR1219292.1 nitrate/sulfonate/bicarbonate ABC transporter ATP-binding protein [Bradyrhizobium sp. U87765 SZCCT0131]MBR1261943.1 nitrate/sulfonate/bicarbonate ABC transporter ATP-binding protein [Bradyrhizobium sp. U87765 SZCCT0134]MBR1306204.1 nitrate/sulfonate/bicarbonate ABC transporter ATP-binding protein [Bradyrhizobium sp. U87765 SZCCT0110]MBR1317725.1 nitrate/sulfonate/bicarbon